ncbi:MAG: YdcF family protein [Deltaproteobacteria bacterium]
MDTLPPSKRYSPREIRVRRWVERRIEALGETALERGFDHFASALARALRVEDDLRARPAIVVLSGGIRSTGHLNATSIGRVQYAAELHRAAPQALFVVSGGPRRPGRPVSSTAMAELARSCGVPADAILEEPLSSRTAENAEEVADLLAARGIRSATLVTSALHMRRARLCFESCDIAIGAAAVPRIEGEPPARASLLSQAIHEGLGLLYYRARTWL